MTSGEKTPVLSHPRIHIHERVYFLMGAGW